MNFFKKVKLKLFVFCFLIGFFPIFLFVLRNIFLSFWLGTTPNQALFCEVGFSLLFAFFVAFYIAKPLKTIQLILQNLQSRSFFKNVKFDDLENEADLRRLAETLNEISALSQKNETMYNNLHESYLALGKMNAQVAALAEINMTFSSNLTWQEKLYYIIESIRAFLQADETLLFVQDQKGQNFVLKHASVDFDFWEGTVLNKKMSLLKKILKDKKFVEFFDSEHFLDKAKAEAKEYRAMFAIPIILNSKVFGVFVLFFKNSKNVRNFPAKLALAYTSQMSIALMMSGELDHSLKKIF